MNNDSLTLGEIKQQVAMFGGKPTKAGHPASCYVGGHVLIRSGQSGVWFGTLDAVEGEGSNTTVRLKGARRVWYWKGAASCSQLATDGPQEGSKIAVKVSSAVVTGVCEIIPATLDAMGALAKVAPWKA